MKDNWRDKIDYLNNLTLTENIEKYNYFNNMAFLTYIEKNTGNWLMITVKFDTEEECKDFWNNWDYYECRSRQLNILREKKLKRILG